MSGRPEAFSALAAYVEREGVSSARIRSMTAFETFVWAECWAGDGSVWHVATDRWGTVFGWADTLPAAVLQVSEQLKARAVTAEQYAE